MRVGRWRRHCVTSKLRTHRRARRRRQSTICRRSGVVMLLRSLARALDPVIFANDCGITPDDWQAELLRSTARRALLLCSRQSGKSTATALLALWVAIFEAPALIIVVSPSQRQSAEMLRTLMLFHAKLDGAPAMLGESVLKVEFSNGSRVIALPGQART